MGQPKSTGQRVECVIDMYSYLRNILLYMFQGCEQFDYRGYVQE